MTGNAEIVVVGAGPAGASAAMRLAKLGLRVLLVDERPVAGGRAFPAPRPDDPFDRPDYRGQALRRGLREQPALIEHRPRCRAADLKPDLTLTLDDMAAGSRATNQAKAVIVATGGRELPVDLPGCRLTGVFALDDPEGLQAAIDERPRARIALGGSGPHLWRRAADLIDAGRNLVAVVDAAPAPTWRQVLRMARQPDLLGQGLGWTRTVWGSRAAVHRVSAIAAIRDENGMRIAEIAPLDAGRAPAEGPHRTVAADLVALGRGMVPDTTLARAAGAAMLGPANDDLRMQPRRSADLETSVHGLFVVGDAGRIAGLDSALAEATVATAAVARRFGRGDDADLQAAEKEARERLVKLEPFIEAVWEWSRYRPGISNWPQNGRCP